MPTENEAYLGPIFTMAQVIDIAVEAIRQYAEGEIRLNDPTAIMAIATAVKN